MIRLVCRGLLVAVATSSLLVVSTSVSAATHTPAEQAQVKPPKIKQVRHTCHSSSGAIVSLKLRNPNRAELSWEVRLFNDEVQQAQAVTLPGRTAERVRFDGIPNGEFSIHVLDATGDTVATAEVVVECTPCR